MRFNTSAAIMVAGLMLSGCATYGSNMAVGNDMSYASLADQRQAALTVKVYDTVPEGGEGHLRS